MQKTNSRQFAKKAFATLALICALLAAALVMAIAIPLGKISAFADDSLLENIASDNPKNELSTPIISGLVNTNVDYNGMGQGVEDVAVILDNAPFSDYIITYKNSIYEESEVQPKDAGVYTVTVATFGEGHQNVTQSATFTINRINPIIRFEGSREQIYGGFLGFNVSAVGRFSDYSEPLTAKYSFGNISQPAAGSYTVSATFTGSINYLPCSAEERFTVLPKDINFTFSGSNDFYYSGFKCERTVMRVGVLPADVDKVNITYLYNGETSAVNAGNYEITIELDNGNYRVGNISGGAALTINPAKLTVIPSSITIVEGQTPNFTFTYSGFVAKETEADLQSLPCILNPPTKPGRYTVTAEGAASKNYTFVYRDADFVINSSSLSYTGDGSGSQVVLKGSFTPETILSVIEIPIEDAQAALILEKLEATRQISRPSDVSYIYGISMGAGAATGDSTHYVISGVKLSKFYSNKVAVINKDGDIIRITKYTYRNETLYFDSDTVGTVVVYKNATLTYVIAGILGFVIVLIIVLYVLAAYRYKKKKKYGDVDESPVKLDYEKPKVYKW